EGRQLLDVEETSNKALCTFRDHNFVGLCKRLQTSRERRCVAYGRFFSRIHGLALLADDDEAGSNANPDLQLGSAAPLLGRAGYLEGCPYCAFCIILICLGIAEIGEEAVAHVLRDHPPEAADGPAGYSPEASNEITEILGIELSRKRRRPNHVAKHDRE